MFDFFGKGTKAVADAAPDTQTDKAASAEEASPAVDPSKAADKTRFEELFPSFKGSYDALSPELRATMLYDLVKATSTAASPIEDESASSPAIRELPVFNMEMAQADFAKAIREEDEAAIATASRAITDYQEQIMGVVHDYNMRNTYDTQKLKDQVISLQRPAEIRALGLSLPGFEETDVAAAAQYLDSGHITDIGAAVQYAILARQAASPEPVKPDAAEEAARQAAAAAAASAPDGESAAGSEEMVATEHFTDARFVDALQQEAAAKE